jgi:hypothetical protein
LEDFISSSLKGGKYAGRSLPQILFLDPDYFFWAVENKVFQGRLATEAAKLSWKARHIKIPKPDPENWCVEYFFTPENKFSWYQFVDPERARHVGSSITSRSKHIDMSVARESCRYDKRGYKRFIKNLKRHLFGNSATKMTAQRCEEFFDDRDNFGSGI